MKDSQTTFLFEEYRSLKSELASLVKEARALEMAAVAGTAGVYAWLAKPPASDITVIGWWIPVLFPAFGLLRQLALTVRIRHIAEYLRTVERTLCVEGPSGWETLLSQKRRTLLGVAIGASAIVFWFALLAVTVTIGIYMNYPSAA